MPIREKVRKGIIVPEVRKTLIKQSKTVRGTYADSYGLTEAFFERAKRRLICDLGFEVSGTVVIS